MKTSTRQALPNAILLLVSCAVCVAIVEGALRLLLPINTFRAGSAAAPNAAVYGWGFMPKGEIPQQDADTGVRYSSRANSGGWKDVEHQLAKANGVKRILILGDSNTFGHVPLASLYTRVVEDLLKQAGINAEVISMGYGGWSTDQALVALKRIGLSYRPDIVVSQFDTNDLLENLALSGIEVNKPFRFSVVNGALQMRELPAPDLTRRLKDRLLKSYVVFYLNDVRQQLLSRLSPDIAGSRDFYARRKDPSGPYFIHHVDERGPDGIEKAWLLYEKLVEAMSQVLRPTGAPLVIFNVVEQGSLEWERRWKRIVVDEAGRDVILWNGRPYPIYFFRHVDRLNAISARVGALMVPNRRHYTRYQNDAHANIEGNRRMAEDIVEFLTTNEQTARVLRRPG